MQIHSREEGHEIISDLIDNQEIKGVLLKEDPQFSAEPVCKKSQHMEESLLSAWQPILDLQFKESRLMVILFKTVNHLLVITQYLHVLFI